METKQDKNKTNETIDEVIMIAFEYSSDAKKIISALKEVIDFEKKEAENKKFLFYPYSDYENIDTKLIGTNEIELLSFFDDIKDPEFNIDRENLHDFFKKAYDTIKIISATKKKLYFIISSVYDEFRFSPYQYMSSKNSTVCVKFICIDTMVAYIKPFVDAGILDSKFISVESESLLDSNYNQKKITETIGKICSNISDIKVKFSDEADEDFEIGDSFWRKSGNEAIKILNTIIPPLIEEFPEHYTIIKELERSLFKALCNEKKHGIRGSFTIIGRSTKKLLTKLQGILQDTFSIPSDMFDTSIYSGEIEAVTSWAGSPPEYKGSVRDGGRVIQLLNKQKGQSFIFVISVDKAANDFQSIYTTLLDQATVENKYTKKGVDASNAFVVTTIDAEDNYVSADPADTLMRLAASENSKLTKGLAERLAYGDLAMTTSMSPMAMYHSVVDTLKSSKSSFEKRENIKVKCDVETISKLYLFNTMNFSSAKRKAEDMLQESILKLLPLLKEKHINFEDVTKIDFNVGAEGEANSFFEKTEVSGFAYSTRTIDLDITNLQQLKNVPTYKELLENKYDYCVLFPESYNDRQCNDLIHTINELPYPIPVFIVASDILTRDSYMVKGGVVSSVVESGSVDIHKWLKEQLDAVVFQKKFQHLKHSAQHITYDTECSLNGSAASVTFTALRLAELWDTEDEEYIRMHSSTPSVTSDDVIGLAKQKNLMLSIADDKDAPRIALLEGPPGTGKTLLASALFDEISKKERCKYMSFAATDFLRGIVGEGEAELKKVFDIVRRYPKITFLVFVDEIDAIGMKRGSASMWADHTRGLLTVFLNEVNGYKGTPQNLIFIGATNHKDSMDSAMLRRFNRIITIPIPKDAGIRNQLVTHYLKKNGIICSTRKIELFVTRTANLSPSAIINILDAAKYNAKQNGKDFDAELLPALEHYLYGDVNDMLSQASKQKTATHEAGHTLMAKHYGRNVDFVTIVAREKFAGYTHIPVDATKPDLSKDEILQEICILTAGRAAEVAIYGEAGITTGASSDFSHASELALSFARDYSMGSSLLALPQEFLPDATKLSQIEEAETVLKKCYAEASELINSQIELLKALSQKLLLNYTLMERDIDEIFSNADSSEKTI